MNYFTRILKKLSNLISKTLPKKPKVQPGWLQMAEPDLFPLIEKQNTVVKACIYVKNVGIEKMSKNAEK